MDYNGINWITNVVSAGDLIELLYLARGNLSSMRVIYRVYVCMCV